MKKKNKSNKIGTSNKNIKVSKDLDGLINNLVVQKFHLKIFIKYNAIIKNLYSTNLIHIKNITQRSAGVTGKKTLSNYYHHQHIKNYYPVVNITNWYSNVFSKLWGTGFKLSNKEFNHLLPYLKLYFSEQEPSYESNIKKELLSKHSKEQLSKLSDSRIMEFKEYKSKSLKTLQHKTQIQQLYFQQELMNFQKNILSYAKNNSFNTAFSSTRNQKYPTKLPISVSTKKRHRTQIPENLANIIELSPIESIQKTYRQVVNLWKNTFNKLSLTNMPQVHGKLTGHSKRIDLATETFEQNISPDLPENIADLRVRDTLRNKSTLETTEAHDKKILTRVTKKNNSRRRVSLINLLVKRNLNAPKTTGTIQQKRRTQDSALTKMTPAVDLNGDRTLTNHKSPDHAVAHEKKPDDLRSVHQTTLFYQKNTMNQHGLPQKSSADLPGESEHNSTFVTKHINTHESNTHSSQIFSSNYSEAHFKEYLSREIQEVIKHTSFTKIESNLYDLFEEKLSIEMERRG